ncbi:MAG TPA: DUF3147 family protein [Burkholderiaceae bacterium]
MEYALKIGISAVLLVAVAELAKRSSHLAALLASLPLTSLLAMLWLYRDTGSTAQVADLSLGIFWLVLPSLALFLVLPLLLRAGWGFWTSLAAAIAATVLCYAAMSWVLRRFGLAG